MTVDFRHSAHLPRKGTGGPTQTADSLADLRHFSRHLYKGLQPRPASSCGPPATGWHHLIPSEHHADRLTLRVDVLILVRLDPVRQQAQAAECTADQRHSNRHMYQFLQPCPASSCGRLATGCHHLVPNTPQANQLTFRVEGLILTQSGRRCSKRSSKFRT